jgi:hypothetical protein
MRAALGNEHPYRDRSRIEASNIEASNIEASNIEASKLSNAGVRLGSHQSSQVLMADLNCSESSLRFASGQELKGSRRAHLVRNAFESRSSCGRWNSEKYQRRRDYITLSAARNVMTSRTTDAAMKISKRSMIILIIA